MGLFRKDPKESRYVGGEKHFAEVIQNVGLAGDLITLHPDEDFNTNSTLIVHPGEQAIFEKNGQIHEVFNEGRHQLKTENYPFISRIRNSFTGGVSSFNCRVYFVRTASSIEIRWGCGDIQVRDKVLRLETTIASRGAYKVRIANAGLFLTKLVGNNIQTFSAESLEDYFSCEMQESIKSTIASVINNLTGEILGIQAQTKHISDLVSYEIKDMFSEYGVELIKFSIASIDIKENSNRAGYEKKLGEAVADRDAIQILGNNDWMRVQQMEVMKTLAQNSANSSLGAEMAMGMIAGNQMLHMGQQMTQQVPPPPPPAAQYYILLNGQNYGPLQMAQMAQYVQSGHLTPNTLVWKAGMPQWMPANTQPELMPLFGAPVPPPPPSVPPTI